MLTYQMDVQDVDGNCFSFECEAGSLDEAERIAREWHPGAKIGRAAVTYTATDVADRRQA